MRWALVACVLVGGAGCRQVLGLDEGVVVAHEDAPPADSKMIDVPPDVVPDVAPGLHDEDEDGVVDHLDNCPSDANTDQATTDMVGVACDPRVEPGDRIAMFLPFFPAARPVELMATAGAMFLEDYVDLDDSEIRTLGQFTPLRVTIDIRVLSIALSNAYLDLSIGVRSCRLIPCAGGACIVAMSGADAESTVLQNFGLDGRMILTQTATELVCEARPASGVPATAVLPVTTTTPSDRLTVRANRSHVQVKNLTVYAVGS